MEILRYTKSEWNRMLILRFMSFMDTQNVDPLWGRYQKEWSDLYSFYDRSCLWIEILKCAKSKWNRILIWRAMSFMGIQNFDTLWGRYQKEWTDTFHVNTRSWVYKNIEMCEILRHYITFYTNYNYSKFLPFVGEALEEVYRYYPYFFTWPRTDANIRICKVGAKSDYPFSFSAENIFFENIEYLWGGGPIYSILTPDLGLIK